MDAVIRVEHVSRRLLAEVPVTLIDDVTMEISASECVAITGPSGSGKSSLLYLLGLLDVPDEGQIRLEGADVARLAEHERAAARLEKIGFVFQSHFLLPEFTARENVLLPMRRLGRRTRQEMVLRADELLQQLGLADHADKMPRQLSGGQSQRVAIARALANEPALILADEPTGNLDSVSSLNVQETILRLAHEYGRAVAVVTHDPAFAARADRVLTLVDGRLVARPLPSSGPTEALRS